MRSAEYRTPRLSREKREQNSRYGRHKRLTTSPRKSLERPVPVLIAQGQTVKPLRRLYGDPLMAGGCGETARSLSYISFISFLFLRSEFPAPVVSVRAMSVFFVRSESPNLPFFVSSCRSFGWKEVDKSDCGNIAAPAAPVNRNGITVVFYQSLDFGYRGVAKHPFACAASLFKPGIL